VASRVKYACSRLRTDADKALSPSIILDRLAASTFSRRANSIIPIFVTSLLARLSKSDVSLSSSLGRASIRLMFPEIRCNGFRVLAQEI
jgi:hypothetical protein